MLATCCADAAAAILPHVILTLEPTRSLFKSRFAHVLSHTLPPSKRSTITASIIQQLSRRSTMGNSLCGCGSCNTVTSPRRRILVAGFGPRTPDTGPLPPAIRGHRVRRSRRRSQLHAANSQEVVLLSSQLLNINLRLFTNIILTVFILLFTVSPFVFFCKFLCN